jgi:hypothetical protein
VDLNLRNARVAQSLVLMGEDGPVANLSHLPPTNDSSGTATAIVNVPHSTEWVQVATRTAPGSLAHAAVRTPSAPARRSLLLEETSRRIALRVGYSAVEVTVESRDAARIDQYSFKV